MKDPLACRRPRQSRQDRDLDEEDRQRQELSSPGQISMDQVGNSEAHEPIKQNGCESAVEGGLIWHG
jgi:hypothetical protein